VPARPSQSRAWHARRVSVADEVAEVACARRELLLRAHRFRLRREDLEDCYSQATLELVAVAQRGRKFASRGHVANAIELRFLSRVRDRRRALSGRSPVQAALERASPLDPALVCGIDVVDDGASVEHLVLVREELRELERLARELTADQRLALASQVAGVGCREFCSATGWSDEKYRKVCQRARLRLRELTNRPGTSVSACRPSVGEEAACDL
jgi:DNA-directed RNA polymerase specialized sigma24 family protein